MVTMNFLAYFLDENSKKNVLYENLLPFQREVLQNMIQPDNKRMKNEVVCSCQIDPMDSKCGQYEGNVSLCACADLGLEGETPG